MQFSLSEEQLAFQETAMAHVSEDQTLLSDVHGDVGWITLNRPKALNALSLEMIRSFAELLNEWEKNAALNTIVIQGAGDKAFCAGGDVRAVYEAKKAGDFHTCDAFFREEYTLNAFIHGYTKPYVSLWDGIAMGGGLGISVNGSHRIITERAILAMPETGIGFFPDVGATTFLNTIQGVIGLYVGLTGARLKAADALWTGLATHFMPSSSLPLFKTALEKGTSLEKALSTYCQHPSEKGFLESHVELIEKHFNQPSLMDIIESLAQDATPFALQTYTTLRAKSPTSLAVVFRQLQEGKSLSFTERMKLEFRLSQHFIEGHDFAEGIRAVLVDKTHNPCWNPATLEDLRDQDIDFFFSSLGERELDLRKTL
ncbi:MAG: enoyl-CoA hydratase/isomerase family protein [Alphaproteobacteria bacterium]|nr:enoyl-CoA hydratase/isomerase family protein [Alphaproteobacteria bacterium]